MKADTRNMRIREIITLIVAVISLAIGAGAATIPSVSTLASLDNGLQTPLRMALDQNGDLYVADPRSGGIVVLDQYGIVSKNILLAKSVNAVALLNPLTSNIPGGKLLVAHSDQVVVLDQSGAEVAKLGSGIGQFKRAAGIALDASGNIYVTDSGSYNVKSFNSAGSYTGAFGTFGAPPTTGVFKQPTAISVLKTASGEQLAVVDTLNGNIQFFTLSGTFIKSVGSSGVASPLLFSYPVGIAFDYVSGVASRMYVLDSYQGQVQVVDVSLATPAFLSYIGSYGFKAGQMTTPSDLVYDQVNRRLLVSNGMSNLLSFGIDGGSNPANVQPPALEIASSTLSTDVPHITISGTVDPGCSLTAAVSPSASASAAAFSSPTSWSIALSGLTPGLNTVSVTAKNQYGATITKTAAVTYLPPSLQLTVDAYPALTGQAALTLTGTTEAGSVVTVYNAATNISGQASVIDNVWIYVVSLVEGPNAISVSSAKSGSSSARKDIVIALDTLAPVVRASLLNDGSTAANQVLSISGTVADQTSLTLTVNGLPLVPVNGQFNTAVTLNLGSNQISIAAVDALGNTSSISRTIIFEPDLPTIAVTAPADGLYTSTEEIMVSLESAAAASVKINGVPALPGAAAGQWNAPVKLAAGINTILIDVSDSYGRIVQEKRTVHYDNVAPVVTITTPSQDSATNIPGVTIAGTVSDYSEITSIRATVNSVDVPLVLSNGQFTVFAEFAKEGAYSVAVSVTDLAGNTATSLRTVIYDLTPPELSVDPVVVAAPSKLEGTVEAGATVVVADASGTLAPVVINGTRWTADLSTKLFEYATLSVTASDAAGNASFNSIGIPLPDGDVDGDGKVTVRDANIIIKTVVDLGKRPTARTMLRGDVGPLFKGKRNPDGKLDIVDGVLILRKALGQESWLD